MTKMIETQIQELIWMWKMRPTTNFKENSRKIHRLKDGKSKIKERNKHAVLQTRFYSPKIDRENLFYSLLMTHIPFRNEDELLLNFNSSKDAFYAKQQHLRPFNISCDNKEYRKLEVELNAAIVQVNALFDENSNENPIPEYNPENIDFIPDVNEPNVPNFQINENEFQENVRKLNSRQNLNVTLLPLQPATQVW
jgi:hypothetical protein